MSSTAHPLADILFPTEAETATFGRTLAPLLIAGDTLLLEGPIGAGKSALARAIIRHRIPDAGDIPSPTFTLVQTYSDGVTEIWHCDLYRLTNPDELMELGLDAAFGTAICLVEWPDRLGADAPGDALRLSLSAYPEGHRLLLAGSQTWAERLAGHV